MAQERFSVDEVAAGTWRIDDGVANFYLRKEGRSGVIIDAGCRRSAPALARALRLSGLQVEDVSAILLTHSHIDHVGVAERVRLRSDAAVYIHPDDEPMTRCRNGGTVTGIKTRLGFDWGLRPALHLFRGGCFPYPTIGRTHELADGEVLDLPGRPRVIALPGHTMGSVAFLFEGSSTLFSGDAITTSADANGAVTCHAQSLQFDEDPAMSVESLDRLEGVQAGLILPGHGPDFTDGVARAVTLARAEVAKAS